MIQSSLVASCRHYLSSIFHRDCVIFLPSLVGDYIAIEECQCSGLLIQACGVSEVDHMPANLRNQDDVVSILGENHTHQVVEHRVLADIRHDGNHLFGGKTLVEIAGYHRDIGHKLGA